MNQQLFAVVSFVIIGTALLTFLRAQPQLVPYVFAAAVVTAVGRVVWLLRSGPGRSRARAVSTAEIRRLDPASLLPWLKDNLRGHDEILERLIAHLRRSTALASARRPLGSFLLVGPTGTGKSYLAELLGLGLYPGKEPVVVRMNRYKDPRDAAVFTGERGAHGHGVLTGPVLQEPRRVILLDEIDKCHPEVLHGLYEILDEGVCRDQTSRSLTVFNACVIVATCNAGVAATRAAVALGGDEATIDARVRAALGASAGLDPSFLARFDAVLLMDELDSRHVAEVACLQIAKHWRQHGIEVAYASPEVLYEAMRRNEEFRDLGVRQLRRFIQSMTDDAILTAKERGERRVRLDYDRETGRLIVL